MSDEQKAEIAEAYNKLWKLLRCPYPDMIEHQELMLDELYHVRRYLLANGINDV